ncbi:MAG: Flp family type IVb pilin [Planctomycetota bacterium]
MVKWIGRRLKALHSDDRGADMVEYVLIVAAVALPLLAFVIWFWKDIRLWVKEAYEKIRGGTENLDDI